MKPLPGLLLLVLAACRADAAGDHAFAEVQARGKVAMGVDQYTSTHRFEPLPAGTAGVAVIGAHMRHIAGAFAAGDFRLPRFVHDRPAPGTAEMTARRDRISYTADTLPGGAEVRIRSGDSIAIGAIHEFLAFQRRDHRAGGAGADTAH